ncbi:MAG: hypothetical protein LBS62_13225 [Clostridiales bacterium]|jgi:NRPS condensation-like uncharacterized protein|nr:hypothetical protein [Clostridiales bacterium]
MNAVIYVSKTKRGSTKVLTEAVARAVGAEAKPVDCAGGIAGADTLFVGASPYGRKTDTRLRDFLMKLTPEQARRRCERENNHSGPQDDKTELLLNYERYLLLAPEINVSVGAKINRRVSDEQIKSALSAVTRRHPILTAAIEIGNTDNTARYSFGKTQPALTIKRVENAESDFIKDTVSFIDGVRTIDFYPFDNSPLVKLSVIADRVSTGFVTVGHHVLGDGLSYYFFLRDFLSALDGAELGEPLYPPVIQGEQALPKNMRLGIPGRLISKYCNHAYANSGKRYAVQDFENLYAAYIKAHSPLRKLFFMTEDETRTMIANCKAHGVTVNDGIATAFCAVKSQSAKPSKYIGVANNIRGILSPNPNGAMGNYTSGVSVPCDYDRHETFWANAKAISVQIHKRLNNPKKHAVATAFMLALSNEIHDAINFYPYENHPHKAMKTLEPILIGEKFAGLGTTNLGKKDCKYNNFDLSDFFFAPPLFGTSNLVVGAITVNGKAAFCLTYEQRDFSEGEIMTMFDEAKSCLLC